MSLVPSLLQAIVNLDGEALVMHVGERPYVVSPTGQVDLSARGLTFDAVSGILGQLLPPESQAALDEFGAVQYEVLRMPEFPQEVFTVVAARGGDDVWVEVRRRRVPDEDRVPAEFFAAPKTAPLVARSASSNAKGVSAQPAVDDLALPRAADLWANPGQGNEVEIPLDMKPVAPSIVAARPAPPPGVEPPPRPVEPARTVEPPRTVQPPRPTEPPRPAEPPRPPGEPSRPPAEPPRPADPKRPSEVPRPVPPPPPPVYSPPPAAHVPPPPQFRPAAPAVVLPLTRSPIRGDVPPPLGDTALPGLDRLIRLAAARGASTLYLSADARPSVRVDGEVHLVEGAPVLGANDVESLLLALMPERNAEAQRTGVATEWIADLPDLGRVRCMSFRDHRGPGGVFRMMPARVVTAEQLGLSREIQSLAIEPEGLVLVAGPRSGGKRTLIAAMVDLINRTRRHHVITIEREVSIVHDRSASFISQREARGGPDDMVAVARAALREDPDVLVLQELRSADLMNLALAAAASGQLVIGGFPAHSASSAIDRVIDLYAPEHRRQVQLSLAQNLRGVVGQVLLRKSGGGRVAAREVLLNTPAVASVLAEGKTSQLPLAIEGGRKHGMVPLNDALVGFVQTGIVDAREAYRMATDRAGFLALLSRQGIDTSFARLA